VLTVKRARVELQKTYAPRTVAVTMSRLLSIMRAAYETGKLARDPTIGTRSKRRRSDDDKVTPEMVPTRAELAAIWRAAPAQYRAAIALGANGLRIGEVLGLTADRVDLEHGLVIVDRQLQRLGNELRFTPPKGEKSRTIGLPDATALELRRHLREHQGGGILFRTPRRGGSFRRDEFYASAWRPALRGAGLGPGRFKFHSLRHFCASSMLAEGVPLPAVAGHLGDTIATLTRVYAHWLRDDRDIPAEALNRVFALPPSTELVTRP
jgi:integrase